MKYTTASSQHLRGHFCMKLSCCDIGMLLLYTKVYSYQHKVITWLLIKLLSTVHRSACVGKQVSSSRITAVEGLLAHTLLVQSPLAQLLFCNYTTQHHRI